MTIKDVGNDCVYCFENTAFGSGRFVNRIPADTETHSGYACAECMATECDRCGKSIDMDEDVSPDLVYSETDSRHLGNFDDDAFRVHQECLSDAERVLFDEGN